MQTGGFAAGELSTAPYPFKFGKRVTRRAAVDTVWVMNPIPLPCIIAVSGVSFRQDVVRTCLVDDPLLFVADDTNPYDAKAVEVRTSGGQIVGFVPRMLAPRLRNTGSREWVGTITEILKGDTWGLRVRIESVVIATRTSTLEPADECETQPTNNKLPVTVRAHSGRVLGQLVTRDANGVTVDSGTGVCRYPLALVEVG